MPPLRTLVADDEPLSRAELAALVQQHPDLELVATCSDGASAIACLEALRSTSPSSTSRCRAARGSRSSGRWAAPLARRGVRHGPPRVRRGGIRGPGHRLPPEALRRGASRGRGAGAAAPRGRGRARGSSSAGGPHGGGRHRLASLGESADQYVHLHTAEGSRLMRSPWPAWRGSPHGFLRVHRSAIVPLSGVRELHRSPRAVPSWSSRAANGSPSAAQGRRVRRALG